MGGRVGGGGGAARRAAAAPGASSLPLLPFRSPRCAEFLLSSCLRSALVPCRGASGCSAERCCPLVVRGGCGRVQVSYSAGPPPPPPGDQYEARPRRPS